MQTRFLTAVLFCSLVSFSAHTFADEAEKDANAGAHSRSLVAKGTLLAPKAFRAAAAKWTDQLVRIEKLIAIEPGQSPAGVSSPGRGPTTGILVSKDGEILTSTYVLLGNPQVITVILPDGTRCAAKVLGKDELRQICMLKIDASKLPEDAAPLTPDRMIDRSELKVGQWAVALGMGLGDEQAAISTGIISATSRIGGKAVQTDAKLSPVNYGGPLVDIRGRMIGICTPLSPQSAEASEGTAWYDSGIGFAVPLAGLDSVLASLREGKDIRQPWLGVKLEPVPGEEGLQISEVVPNSPAAKADLKVKDRILEFAGEKVASFADLQKQLHTRTSGDKVTVKFQRGEETLEAEIELQPRPE